MGPNPVLKAGEYSFPFEFHLPEDNLPTTFEGKHGCVKYWLKAIIDRPWKEDKTVMEAFNVVERVDVNQPEFLVRSDLFRSDQHWGNFIFFSSLGVLLTHENPMDLMFMVLEPAADDH